MITNEIKAKVFAQYLFCQCAHVDYTESGILNATFLQDVNLIKLILKPLSLIIDEDLYEVNKIIRLQKLPYHTDVLNHHDLEYQCFSKTHSCFSGYTVSMIVDFLRSKGYDLPQYLLGGKTLKEAGLAIYE